ncbi:MAG: hypothetical protein RL291_905 [Pseudomonadota bacterium]
MLTPAPKRSSSRPETFAVLDVGTSKVVAAILARDIKAPLGPDGQAGYRLIGLGKSKARGLKASVVMNLGDVTQSIEAAVEAAEKAAGLTLDGITVAVPTGRLRGATVVASVSLQSSEVGEPDLAKIVRAGDAYVAREGRRLVHLNPIAYRIDGGHPVGNPMGLAGQRLSADIHVVSADETPLQHLIQAVEGANLAVDKLVPTPVASALAVTTEDERRAGTIVVDFGAGSTTMALYADGHLVNVAALPVGGNHLTFDLSRSFGVSIPEAERIKTNYGTLLQTQMDAHTAIPLDASASRAGDQQPSGRVVTVADVREVLAERCGKILAMVRERVEASGLSPDAFQSVVLTGGSSRLTGFVATVSRGLARPVRLGEPMPLIGESQSLRHPEFAAVAGLMATALDRAVGQRIERQVSTEAPSKLGLIGKWFSQSF